MPTFIAPIRFAAASLVPALLFTLSAASPAAAQGASLTVTPIEKGVFDLVNQERAREQLPAYKPNAKLFAAARKYAAFMAQLGQGIGHQLDGRLPWDRTRDEGYPAQYVLENVAGGQIDPAHVVRDWMNSPAGHRTTIMNTENNEVGVGFAKAADGTNVWVLLNGRSDEAQNPPQLVLDSGTAPTTVSVRYTNETDFNILAYFTRDGANRVELIVARGERTIDHRPGEQVLVTDMSGNVLRTATIQNNDPIVVRAGSTPPSIPPASSVLAVSSIEKALFDEINGWRVQLQLPAFKPNAKLFTAARDHASHMARIEELNHTLDRMTPTDRGRALGYPSHVDEVYNGGAVSPQQAVQGWLAKPHLRAKLLAAHTTEIGIGFARSPDANVWNITLGASSEANMPPQLQVQ